MKESKMYYKVSISGFATGGQLLNGALYQNYNEAVIDACHALDSYLSKDRDFTMEVVAEYSRTTKYPYGNEFLKQVCVRGYKGYLQLLSISVSCYRIRIR